MITREQIYTMLMMNNRRDTLFSALPIDIIKEISEYGQNPSSEIAKALTLAAYARQEDVDALKTMLEANPSLLFLAGNVQTPGGDEIKRVTLYEFVLGAGDDELAGIVQSYFAKIDNGEQEMIRQYERYRPHIEGILTQKPYDLSPLIELIKKATPEQVTALLHKDMTGDNELCKALSQFRKDWAPKVLTKPGMHYNYASLQHAFELLDREWGNLYKASNDNYDKIRLVWRQLIGFEMRRLPGIDRCMMAQGLYYVVDEKETVARSYTYREVGAAGSFPVTTTDDSIDGLGGDVAVDIFGLPGGGGGRAAQMRWKTYVEQKLQTCRTYAASPSSSAEPVCNTLSC
ncbi:TPA: hypothetical protein JBE16_07080 [Legionella pneumophila subsp. pneumophila]|nr:hypothetical protein [Legionella pneumophila subsp. pneumophila]HAT9650549.1 hypothetical protein [Legionella pneumophila subsp. pneumophila]HAT9919981.1 hypothetical protein [Legionella pneumophila subsp. pneumophila]